MQCQPVVAHGVLYATSPKLRVFALDAATGAEKWSFNPLEAEKTPSADPHPRPDVLGAGRRPAHLLRRPALALRARRNTGKPLASFGQQGRIDLRQGFRGRDPRALSVGVNTPGVFYGDLLILGSVVPGRAAVGARRHPRVRHPHRRAEVGVPHDPASRRVRLRHVAEGRLEVHRRRQRLVGHLARREARARLCRHRIGRVRLLRRQPPRRQPVREHHPVPARGDRRARVALPGREARRVGPRLSRLACARSRSTRTAAAATSSRRSPRTAAPTSSTARPASRSSRWRRSRRRPPTCPASACRRRRCCRHCRRRSRGRSSPRTSSRRGRLRRRRRCARSG